ncbi:hypothetical protein BD324DRAFT_657237 [Kockovaella imperatae]|uniref:Uncharacterized protein n=1 Tax=Kockovaella imperatae TaxID=4999 RepID=A0A1Y1UFD0_9TREE|nr:hypothetical protein BD324DRAFT_657237 [Kockovaella imperatae]ORX35785.1 hypothetical protein BD324DRAFT_657237 [Kockovaella imperatae]
MTSSVDKGTMVGSDNSKDAPSKPRQVPAKRPPFPTPAPSALQPATTAPTSSSSSSSLPSSSRVTSPLAYTSVIDSPLLPFIPLAAPQIGNIRAGLKRRRSSFPPAAIPGSSLAHEYPWVVGGTPAGKTFHHDIKADWNVPLPVPNLAPETVNSNVPTFSSLLHFDPTPLHTPTNLLSSLLFPTVQSADSANVMVPIADSSVGGPSTPKDTPRSPGTIARFGADLAWKTILGSVVEVEGVGEIEVTKVMLEVWRRGGGDVVTSQNLWLNIVIALQLPSQTVGARIPTPSTESAAALQKVYNLTLRPWEASIFCGLLANYTSPSSASSSGHRRASTPVYGPATPTKELDLSQWTNFSPGTNDLSSLLGVGITPKHTINVPSSLGQFEFHAEADRRTSSAEQSVNGLEALLAEIEEGHAANERAAVTEDGETENTYGNDVLFKAKRAQPSRQPSLYQLPTPNTDTTSPAGLERRHSSSAPGSCALSPEHAASPYVTASTTASAVSRAIPSVAAPAATEGSQGPRVAPPTSVPMPTSTFVPPPPMCMFFSPQFRDLEKGKVGVWKGDLEITGRGGGRFSILIVGEENTGHLWQSHLWPTKISYPPEPAAEGQTTTSSCTSTMIPVSHLAREGFTPITMGMVLCNDANISEYVAMVQGFHAEGVAFHLPNPAKLPIVFLPAKFDSADPLQRLGIAFMSKPGMPLPKPVSIAVKQQAAKTVAAEQDRKRKRQRRQSAPAKASVGSHRRRKSEISENDGPEVVRLDSPKESAIDEEEDD